MAKSPNQLPTKYNQVATTAYDLAKPITVIFDVVNDQRELGELARKSHTPSQIMDLALLEISNYLIFRDNVSRWLHLPYIPNISRTLLHFSRSSRGDAQNGGVG